MPFHAFHQEVAQANWLLLDFQKRLVNIWFLHPVDVLVWYKVLYLLRLFVLPILRQLGVIDLNLFQLFFICIFVASPRFLFVGVTLIGVFAAARASVEASLEISLQDSD